LLQYSAWFEELRKQRVAELKRELEKSENSIGLVPICSLLSEHFCISLVDILFLYGHLSHIQYYLYLFFFTQASHYLTLRQHSGFSLRFGKVRYSFTLPDPSNL
jgi:hypothetical protein